MTYYVIVSCAKWAEYIREKDIGWQIIQNQNMIESIMDVRSEVNLYLKKSDGDTYMGRWLKKVHISISI